MATYSIVQVNINDYDPAYNNGDLNSKENLLFTDRKQNVHGWKQVLIQSNQKYPFNEVFKYRWKLLDYSDTDYVIWVDGSLSVNGSLKGYIDRMEQTGSEFAVIKHPQRNNVFDEYNEWCKIRHYNKETAYKWLAYLQEQGINIKNSGLVQTNLMIMKRCENTKNFIDYVWKELHHFDKENIERLDQTVVTCILKKDFPQLKVMLLCERDYNSHLISNHWNAKHLER